MSKPLPLLPNGEIDWGQVEQNRMKRDEEVRQRIRAEQAAEEERARQAAEAASKPAMPEPEFVSTQNMRIVNGKLVPFQQPTTSQTAIKIQQFNEASIAARQGKR